MDLAWSLASVFLFSCLGSSFFSPFVLALVFTPLCFFCTPLGCSCPSSIFILLLSSSLPLASSSFLGSSRLLVLAPVVAQVLGQHLRVALAHGVDRVGDHLRDLEVGNQRDAKVGGEPGVEGWGGGL